MAEQVDVLICGSGSAGLCAAVWFARCGVSYKVLDRRAGPLVNGQADGVQCRTVEIFESFGISEPLLREAYHVLEIAFWAAEGGDKDDGAGIRRTHYAPDLEKGLSHQPHVILNQARINGLMIEEIERVGGGINVEYGVEVKGVDVDSATTRDLSAYSCTTKAVGADGAEKTYRSKYVLACDGAHSAVRKSLGFKMVGDSSDSIWGVMDVYPRTDFPDIRKKAVLHAPGGNLMIIPREGDSMVRFYMELKNAAVKDVTLEGLKKQASQIFKPYSMEIVETVWWSAYLIGQRLADNFTKDNRVFLTGDACHTHSPKAGQGMNVSLQDGYNIGWKLAAVLRGQATPEILDTYVLERQKTASDLIEFDRTFTNYFSSSYRQKHGITAEQFKDHFVKSGRYTAGQGTHYAPSTLVSPDEEAKELASGLVVGMRFPSAQVVRFSDAKAVQLVRSLPADSRWHVLVFPGDLLDPSVASKVAQLSHVLDNTIRRYTPTAQDTDSVIQALLVYSSKRLAVEQDRIPKVFTPVTGKWGITNLHKVFADDESYNSGHGHAYETYGIDPKKGCWVIVRPDHYISRIGPLDRPDGISQFFEGFLVPRNGDTRP